MKRNTLHRIIKLCSKYIRPLFYYIWKPTKMIVLKSRLFFRLSILRWHSRHGIIYLYLLNLVKYLLHQSRMPSPFLFLPAELFDGPSIFSKSKWPWNYNRCYCEVVLYPMKYIYSDLMRSIQYFSHVIIIIKTLQGNVQNGYF